MKPFAYDNVIDRNTSKPYVLAQQAQQQKRIPNNTVTSMPKISGDQQRLFAKF